MSERLETWVRERTWRVQADLNYPEKSWYAGKIIADALREAINIGKDHERPKETRHD